MYAGHDSPSEIQYMYPKIVGQFGKIEENIGLGHRRFSIIDLTIGGHQPFLDQANHCAVVANGEIYNYIELRHDLLKRGHTFRSESDTEVIVEAYKEWGVECFKHFNGMWALALYDFRRKILLISRDRSGKKPLYWTKHNGFIYFASEIKSLFEIPGIANKKSLNEDAMYHHFVCNRRDINSETFFRDIYSLPAASWAVLNQDFPGNVNKYWNLPEKRLSESDISVAEASKSIRDILEDAVRIRLRADVPWAIELSGGMDSSAMVAMASQVYQKQLTTYTVRFSEERWNEEPYARSVAKRYHTQYHVIDSPLDNFWHEIVPFTYLEEEPYHSPNAHTSQVIRRMMRGEGVKMFLNGAAGDELFAGYRSYFSEAQIENVLSGQFTRYMQNSLGWTEAGLFRSFVYPLGRCIKQTLAARGKEARKFVNIPNHEKVSCYRSLFLSKRLHYDFVHTLIPYWLRSSDKTQMGIPIVGRPKQPIGLAHFLDLRVETNNLGLPCDMTGAKTGKIWPKRFGAYTIEEKPSIRLQNG